jgi:uncharacterized BrkB/YihY/UPF0761 family membrane protein
MSRCQRTRPKRRASNGDTASRMEGRALAELARGSDANLFLVAGGVTYAILLALFPVLAALISLYGLMFDPLLPAVRIRG